MGSGGGPGGGGRGPGAEPRFQPLRTAAFDLLAAGDYRGVLPLALEAEALYPAKGEAPFWLACVHCRLGDTEGALAALRAGLARGHYWPADWLLEDDDLEPLRGRPELEAILRESAAARSAGSGAGALEPVVLDPSGATDGGATPAALVLAFHGWGQDADELALHWRAAAACGFAVIVPRSSQQPTPGFFVWDDRETALAEVAAQFRRACGAVSDGAAAPPLLLAGFSQGGGLAVDLAIDAEPAPCVGFLAVAAGTEDLVVPPGPDRLAPAAARGLRGRLLVGDRDEALSGAHALAEAGARAGLSWALTVRPGAGHEMPEPPGELVADELAALLG